MPVVIRIEREDQYDTRHFVHTVTGSGEHLWTLTGVALLVLEGDQPSHHWRRERIWFFAPIPSIPRDHWVVLSHWAPLVTLNAVNNDGAWNWGGWAVDRFYVSNAAQAMKQVEVETDVAVRDNDGRILRLGYNITILGRFVEEDVI